MRAPLGPISSLRDSVDLLPRGSDDDWRDIAALLAAIPAMFEGWRASLELGLARGLPAARAGGRGGRRGRSLRGQS